MLVPSRYGARQLLCDRRRIVRFVVLATALWRTGTAQEETHLGGGLNCRRSAQLSSPWRPSDHRCFDDGRSPRAWAEEDSALQRAATEAAKAGPLS
jgi:hypothetical protein